MVTMEGADCPMQTFSALDVHGGVYPWEVDPGVPVRFVSHLLYGETGRVVRVSGDDALEVRLDRAGGVVLPVAAWRLERGVAPAAR